MDCLSVNFVHLIFTPNYNPGQNIGDTFQLSYYYRTFRKDFDECFNRVSLIVSTRIVDPLVLLRPKPVQYTNTVTRPNAYHMSIRDILVYEGNPSLFTILILEHGLRRFRILLLQVDFSLLILGDYSVVQAYIHLDHDKVIPLELVHGQSHLWRYSAMLPGDPIKHQFKYKYDIRSKGQDIKIPFLGIRSNDPTYCVEFSERRLESQAQFDVFHFPEDKQYLSETTPKAVIFYLKLLLQAVHPSSISEILTQIESLRFIAFSAKHVKECMNWIVDHASGYSVSDVQRLFLCITLGHLKNSSFSLPFPNDDMTVEACDRLLQCLNACVDSNFLSTSSLECLKKIAVILVENSSTPGWLTLATHFYLYLGIEFVIDTNNSRGLKYRYDVKEYKKMAGALLSHIKKRNGYDQVAHQNLLDLVLDHAPNLEAASEIFESVDFCWFFTNEDEKDKFYQGTTRGTSTQNKSVGARLIEFYNILEKIRGKTNKFLFSTLLEYSKSDEELNDEHADIFQRSIISGKYLDMNEVLAVLMELAKSKSVSRQNLLLEILDKELFEQQWRTTQLARKMEICKSWVITRMVNNSRASSLGGADKIAAVYGAIDAIMRCSLNISNKPLAQNLSTYAAERFLRNEDAISFLQTFVSIEKCVAVVQECYMSHVRKILVQAPKVVKKSSMFLKECSNSRYNVLIAI